MNLTKAQSVYETFLHEIYKHFFAKRHFILANTQTPLFWLPYFIISFLKPDLPLFLIADIFFERFSFPLQKNRVNCYFIRVFARFGLPGGDKIVALIQKCHQLVTNLSPASYKFVIS